MTSLRGKLASALEGGRLGGAPVLGSALRTVARTIAPLATRRLARPLVAPAGVELVTVGGATIGGSGKTRLALAVTRALASRGVPVALIGHAYRARPGRARRVLLTDALAEVGDEALACARALDGLADVVVAPRRSDAVALAAARGARVVVLDGPLRTTPARSALALLAVDPRRPFGSGQVLPAGDLRAPAEELVAAADLVVEVAAVPAFAVVGRDRVPLPALGPDVAGLFTAVARPERLVEDLGRAGMRPPNVVSVPDHGPLDAAAVQRLRSAEKGLWLASSKCAEHLRAGLGEPWATRVAVVEDAFSLSERVLAALPGGPHRRTSVP